MPVAGDTISLLPRLGLASSVLARRDRAEVARYFRAKLVDVLHEQEFEVVDDVGENVARIQIAMTDVANSTWLMRIHPASRAAGDSP